MALTGAQKGIEEPGTQSSMHSGGCDPGECSSENPRMQCSQEVRRVFRSRRQRPAIKCAWPAPQAARCRGTQAPRLCRFGKFDSPERVMRLDFVSFGAFWLHHSIYNSSLLGYKGLLWYQGAGLNFLQ